MSEKHNQHPTTRKKLDRYRKTIELNSASQWNSFDLDLFHVNFPPKQPQDITEIVEHQFYRIDDEANEIHLSS